MAGTKTVLVVEDEQILRETLTYNLAHEGYCVLSAGDGHAAIDIARRERPDLIVLDLMLPQVDGFEVCRVIRQEMAVPILVLTARDSEVDTVLGLELGADEYVTKPFALRPLLARVKALLRRAEMSVAAQPPAEADVVFGDFVLDRSGRRLHQGPREIPLTMKEYDLLAFLIAHKGHALARDFLLEKVWGYDFVGNTRTVDVHIRWLREKIEHDPSDPQYIVTVRGVGYRFEDRLPPGAHTQADVTTS
jgi:DNA-binding response OmpR family regulator